MFTAKKRDLGNLELLTAYAEVSQLPLRDKLEVLQIAVHDIQNSHGT